MIKRRKTNSELKGQFFFTLFCVSICSFFGVATIAMSAPTQNAPLGNPEKPIHTGNENQTKNSNLTVNNQFNSTTTNATSSLSATTICLNGSCRTNWPSASYSTPSLQQALSNGNSTTRSLWVSSNSPNGYVCLGGQCRNFWPKPNLSGWGSIYYVDPPNGNGQWSYCPAGYLACGIRSNLYRYHTPEMLICCSVNFSTS